LREVGKNLRLPILSDFERNMLFGKDAMRNSTSRLGPMIEGSPRLAATHASNSLASSSRTWFSTGTNKAGFFDFIFLTVLCSLIHTPKTLGNTYSGPKIEFLFWRQIPNFGAQSNFRTLFCQVKVFVMIGLENCDKKV
jgi:hypothetical protein